jgi:hypothetical protein
VSRAPVVAGSGASVFASVFAPVLSSVVAKERVDRGRAAEGGLPGLRPAGKRFPVPVGPVGTGRRRQIHQGHIGFIGN